MPVLKKLTKFVSSQTDYSMHATLKEKLLALPFYVLPHHGISWLMFKCARIRYRPVKNFIIRTYTNLNPVKMHEAIEEDMFAYEHLNAFFTRALKPQCRPLDTDDQNWICPVDGSVSQAQAIEDGEVFQAKGCFYSLLKLLGGDKSMEADFHQGNFATIYLSPRDYHRIHMPVTGKLKKMIYIPGRLFSVANFTVNAIPNLFAINERCVCYFETNDGPMVMVLVGAINVSAMETVWHEGIITAKNNTVTHFDYADKNITLKRGEEMGRFNLGSTVIVLSAKQMEMNAQMQAGNEVKLGQALARKRD